MAGENQGLSTRVHEYSKQSICVQVGSGFFTTEDKSTQTSQHELMQMSWKPCTTSDNQQLFQGICNLTYNVVGKRDENNIFVDWITANPEIINGFQQSTLPEETHIDHDLGLSDIDVESNTNVFNQTQSVQSSNYSRRKSRPTRLKETSDIHSNVVASLNVSSHKVFSDEEDSKFCDSSNIKIEESIKPENYNCNICNKVFETRETLHRHFVIEHYSLTNEDLNSKTEENERQIDGYKSINDGDERQIDGYKSRNDEDERQSDEDQDGKEDNKTGNEMENDVAVRMLERHFYCKECSLNFRTSHALRIHSFTHRLKNKESNKNKILNIKSTGDKCERPLHRDKKFKCSYCNKCFVYYKMMRKHQQHKCIHRQGNSEHIDTNDSKIEDNPEISYKCSVCGEGFSSVSEYIKHETEHEKSLSTQCRVCNLVCDNPKSLQSHIQDVHSKSGLFFCTYCDKICCSLNNLVSHTHNKHKIGSKSFQCEMCGKSFSLLTQLRNHSKIHNENKPYQCSYCSFQTKEGHSLTVHVRRKHTGEKPFVCETCGKSFCSSNTLQRHIRTHTGEKPYKCHVCGDQFAAHWTLSIHVIRKHTTERPHQCDVCGTTFAYKSDLTKHKLIHESVKPFSCEICSAGFTTKSKKRKHVKTAHLMEEPESPLLV